MRQQPLTTGAAAGTVLVVILVWTLGVFSGDLASQPAVSTVELAGLGAVLWRVVCVAAGLLVVLSARPALRRLDPSSRPGAAALLVQLGGVGMLLLGVAPAGRVEESAVLAPADPSASYGTVAALAIGALLPAAGFLLAARWRQVQALRRETIVSFAVSTVALWASLAYSAAPDGNLAGLAQRVAFTVALGWVAWLLTRSLDPQHTAGAA